jgi:hypothetical protein
MMQMMADGRWLHEDGRIMEPGTALIELYGVAYRILEKVANTDGGITVPLTADEKRFVATLRRPQEDMS